MNHENSRCPEHFGLHLGFKIAKLALTAGLIAVGICVSKEIHKVHKAIEKREK